MSREQSMSESLLRSLRVVASSVFHELGAPTWCADAVGFPRLVPRLSRAAGLHTHIRLARQRMGVGGPLHGKFCAHGVSELCMLKGSRGPLKGPRGPLKGLFFGSSAGQVHVLPFS